MYVSNRKHYPNTDILKEFSNKINGELGKIVDDEKLDIALTLEDKKVDIEILTSDEKDRLSKIDPITEDEFYMNLLRRDNLLVAHGWKVVRFNCFDVEIDCSHLVKIFNYIQKLLNHFDIVSINMSTKIISFEEYELEFDDNCNVNQFISNQMIVESFSKGNKDWYISKGYPPKNIGHQFLIHIKDIYSESKACVKIVCNECGKVEVRRYDLMIKYEPPYVCRNNTCIMNRKKMTYRKHYGVDHYFQSNEGKIQIKQSIFDHYGSLGFSHPDIRNKFKSTCEERYGGPSPMASQKVRNKVTETIMKNHGVKAIIQIPERRKEMQAKACITMHENGTGPASKNQKHICDLVKGELNYPFKTFLLDTVLLDEMIDIEYDGGGHWLQVKTGKETPEQAMQKQLKREKYILGNGYKLIRIISDEDKLFKDDKLLKLINICRDYLNTTDHHWIHINIDELKIKSNALNLELDQEGNVKE